MVLSNQVLSGPGEEETFLFHDILMSMKSVRLGRANVLHGLESLREEVCDRCGQGFYDPSFVLAQLGID